MGSLLQAHLTGFVCRLCSTVHKYVVHLYGLGHRNLIKKIKKTLDVEINYADKLPKTICVKCLEAVEKNYAFIRMVTKNHRVHAKRIRLSPDTAD